MTTLTATDARKTLFDLLKGTNERHEVYRIRSKSGGAVLMSETEFDNLQETLELLSTPGFREGFKVAQLEEAKGNTVSFEDVFGEKQ